MESCRFEFTEQNLESFQTRLKALSLLFDVVLLEPGTLLAATWKGVVQEIVLPETYRTPEAPNIQFEHLRRGSASVLAPLTQDGKLYSDSIGFVLSGESTNEAVFEPVSFSSIFEEIKLTPPPK